MELKQGTALQKGKYKIVKVLGSGSFGITYLATTRISIDGQLGKMDVTVNVTIKEFFMADLNSRATDGTSVEKTSSTLVKNYQTKFRKEAENLAKLHHPNIVKVLEVFDENNTTYYVMEYVDGETVDDYIKLKGYLLENEALQITQKVCAALSYMHKHKMLHLDLKPKNIMRNAEGHIFLIDFGLAKQYTEKGEPESSTTIGLGTPGYAPVEQAHYEKDGTFPVTLDVYALGATLFKMLTGKTPPESSYVLNEGLPLQQLKEAGISDTVIAIVKKAMAPRKKERYQSVEALSSAISFPAFDNENTVIQEEQETNTSYNDQIEDIIASNNNTNQEGEDQETGYEFEEDEPSLFEKYWKYGVIGIGIIIGGVYFYSNRNNSSGSSTFESSSSLDSLGLVADSVYINESMGTQANNFMQKETSQSLDAETNMKEGSKVKEVSGEELKPIPSKVSEQPQSQASVGAFSLSDIKANADNDVLVAKAKEEVTKTESAENNKVYDVVEQMPSFPGGDAELMKYLSSHIRYPIKAEENGIQGRVITIFTVERDGSITDIKIIKSIDPLLDKEAIRVINNMPKWIPGKQKGFAVRVRYTLPVSFRLK